MNLGQLIDPDRVPEMRRSGSVPTPVEDLVRAGLVTVRVHIADLEAPSLRARIRDALISAGRPLNVVEICEALAVDNVDRVHVVITRMIESGQIEVRDDEKPRRLGLPKGLKALLR